MNIACCCTLAVKIQLMFYECNQFLFLLHSDHLPTSLLLLSKVDIQAKYLSLQFSSSLKFVFLVVLFVSNFFTLNIEQFSGLTQQFAINFVQFSVCFPYTV